MPAPIVKCITKEARERDGFSSFKEWCDTPNHIYIGPNIRKYLKDYSKKDSLWCNPFRNYDLTKSQSNEFFETFVRSNPFMILQLEQLESKVLGCWCRTDQETCHGDILVKLYEEFVEKKNSPLFIKEASLTFNITVEKMELKNLKVSLIFDCDIYHKFESKNYIFKIDDAIFTIYKHSPFLINITGLKNFNQITLYKKQVEERFNKKVQHTRIDNTFFSLKQKRRIDLNEIYNFLKNNKIFHVNFNIELFSGMYLHPKGREMPTLLLFHTGSYVIMGGKNLKTIYKCENFLKKLISKFEKKKMSL